MSALGPGPTEWGAPTGGVGPWAGDLPDDPRYDPVLLRDGDARNVVDAYRYWTREAIIADIDTRRHPLHVAIENFGHDANIGSVVRTANAFAVHTVHIVGRRRWNRRGAMVTDRYQRLCHHDSTTGLLEFAAGAGLTVVAVDNVPGAARLEQTALPRECLLLFGQEGPGITDDARAGAAVTRRARFLVGPYETALAHNEVLIEVRIPLRHNTSSAYAKVERRVGDWAITAAGAAVTLDGQTILAARVGLTAVNPDPVALAELSAGLVGQPATEEVFAEAGRRAAQACTPVTDVRGTAEYKRHLAGELTVRTLRTAAGRVLGAPAAPEA